jgi:hypothetical protein
MKELREVLIARCELLKGISLLIKGYDGILEPEQVLFFGSTISDIASELEVLAKEVKDV